MHQKIVFFCEVGGRGKWEPEGGKMFAFDPTSHLYINNKLICAN